MVPIGPLMIRREISEDTPGMAQARPRAQGRFLPVHQGYAALQRLTSGHLDGRTKETAAFVAVIKALAAYAGDLWEESMHLRVLTREIAVAAVVVAQVDAYVLAAGALRPDGTLQPVLDRRLSWGAALRKDIAMFEDLVHGIRPGAGPFDFDRLLASLLAKLRQDDATARDGAP